MASIKILIIHQYFKTPLEGGSLRSYYLARGLSQKGYSVEVITSHNRHGERTKNVEGVTVHYLPVFYDNHLGFWSRIHAFVKFARLALKKARSLQHIDLCYVMSTPLTVGWTALKLKSQRRLPFIFEVGDLWPEAPVQMGILKNPLLIYLLRRFERNLYRQAQRVVALSPDIKKAILKQVPSCQVTVVPNMSDCRYFHPTNKTPKIYQGLDLQGKFVILYFGAAGKANHLEFLIEAARYMDTQEPSIHFLIAAYGSELSHIRDLAQNLANITFLNYLSKEEIRKVLSVSEAVYVSYADVPVLGSGSPNKFFDGLAAGKLVILNFKGWLKELVESQKVGFYSDPYHPEDLFNQLKPFMEEPSVLQRFQKNARKLAEEQFSVELALEKIQQLMPAKTSTDSKDFEVYTLTG